MKFIDWFAEEWMTIEGYDGAYQVSNYGNVKSIERVVIRSNGRPKRRVCMIDPATKEIVSIFESINDAERKTGICSQNIQKMLKGIRKTAGGYEWG